VQQSGNGQTTSGGLPAQSDCRAIKLTGLVVLRSQIVCGISPTKLLRSNSNSVNLVKLPGEITGMVPVSWFPSKYKSCKLGGVEYCAGIGPLKVLLEKYAF
jgi:hypothetical protein